MRVDRMGVPIFVITLPCESWQCRSDFNQPSAVSDDRLQLRQVTFRSHPRDQIERCTLSFLKIFRFRLEMMGICVGSYQIYNIDITAPDLARKIAQQGMQHGDFQLRSRQREQTNKQSSEDLANHRGKVSASSGFASGLRLPEISLCDLLDRRYDLLVKFFTTSLLLSLTAIIAEASTILHTVDPQLYRDEAALYPMVGKVTGSGLNGSGVMLSDRWVLTAGHISQLKANGLGFFNVGGVDYTIANTILHPGYSTLGPAISNDIGLLYLSAPVTGISATEMFRFDQPASILGREATYVGHGYSGTGLTGAQSTIELRAFTNLIEFYGDQYGLTTTSFVSDFDNPTGTSNRQDSNPVATRLEGAVAPGDSGGGVFVTVGGVRYLIGINSYSGAVSPATSNSQYGGLSGAVDLQQFHSWISANTGISAVPEPSALWLCGLGSLLALRRRR